MSFDDRPAGRDAESDHSRRESTADEAIPRRKRWPWIVMALALLLVLDLSRAPQQQLSAGVLLAGIDGYQSLLSPHLSSAGVSCRFEPSCSRYAEGVIKKYGALGGTRRAAWRILRCGPWTEPGTVDPP